MLLLLAHKRIDITDADLTDRQNTHRSVPSAVNQNVARPSVSCRKPSIISSCRPPRLQQDNDQAVIPIYPFQQNTDRQGHQLPLRQGCARASTLGRIVTLADERSESIWCLLVAMAVANLRAGKPWEAPYSSWTFVETAVCLRL